MTIEQAVADSRRGVVKLGGSAWEYLLFIERKQRATSVYRVSDIKAIGCVDVGWIYLAEGRDWW
jgi:hypothetical protein